MSSSPQTLPYLGSKISLISNAGIRYEGVLFNINTNDSTVGLKDVRTFGTEGRKPGAEVSASEDVYDYIVFRGKDIQDLTVSDPAPPDDPAIVAINHLSDHPFKNNNGNNKNNFNMMNNRSSQQQHQQQQSRMMMNDFNNNMIMNNRHHNNNSMQRNTSSMMYHNNQSNNNQNSMMNMMMRDDFNNNNRRGGGYQGSYGGGNRRGGYNSYNRGNGRIGGNNYSGNNNNQTRRVIGELSAQPNQNLKSQLEKAFDFDEANKKFEKAPTISATASTTGPNPVSQTTEKENEEVKPIKSVYDKKSSFFDHISCETLDRQVGNDTRVDRTKQRQLDIETFGQSASVPIRRGGRGYRRGMGYGRGGGMMRGSGYMYGNGGRY